MPLRKCLAIAQLWRQHPAMCGTGPHEERPLGSFRRPEDHDLVHFGTTVQIARDDGREQTFRIVGEDAADPGRRSISHASPLARAMFGKRVGRRRPRGSRRGRDPKYFVTWQKQAMVIGQRAPNLVANLATEDSGKE
jgi:Transcription elongation factor, GreA/GreB, C-term